MHRVDAVVVEEHAGCREVVLERGADAEVDGVLDAVGAREALGQRRDRGGGRHGELQPAARARVARDPPQPARVRHDADVAPARQRLALEQLGGVEQRLGALDPQHARLAQQRVDRGLVAERPGGVRQRLAAADGRGCP